MLGTSTIRKVEDSIAGGGELVLRLALGITFFAHGRHKITDPNAFATFLKQLGVPAPELSAWSVALLETVGAACLMLGIGARPIAFALAVDMAVALAKVRIPKAPFTSGPEKSGWDSEFMLFASALALAFTGGGRFSIDYALGLDSNSGARARG
jgi:putative oxidoreductase